MRGTFAEPSPFNGPTAFFFYEIDRLNRLRTVAIRLGIWDSPAVDFLVAGLAGSDLGIDTSLVEPNESLDLVREGAVDVALAPTLDIIGAGGVEVLPAVALSSWRFPYARLHLPDGLGGSPRRVFFDRAHAQEALIARVVLREHYGMEPSFAVISPDERPAARDARLFVGRDVPGIRFGGVALDLGEEWYEMANYPMVWGVFAVRTGHASGNLVDRLRLMVERSEAARGRWADSKDQGEAVRHFFAEDIRLRFDDLAVASITELMEHAFYHDLIDEITDFPVATIEDDGHDEQTL